ncbi:DUF6364 family protein [Ferroplasma acidarmanus]|uniref:Uncharacterized protein n=1 Tax=Ferroplasma acidarmanus Fer1 TaxID=333146 RepID=S0AP98_FERAC|nr:DUF6364 family protein [Ferroplasma acidarmanus]AGO60019.1 hypothetical protein FACI_IFERC00001G0039 [Ferroplasma acidarmanus Fer1]
MKKKLTLLIDEDIIIKAKSILLLKNVTLSEFVETKLRLLLSVEEHDKSFIDIGIKYNYTSPDEIVEKRKKLKIVDTQKILDETRDEMDKRLS